MDSIPALSQDAGVLRDHVSLRPEHIKTPFSKLARSIN